MSVHPEWEAKLDGMSKKFRELKQKVASEQTAQTNEASAFDREQA